MSDVAAAAAAIREPTRSAANAMWLTLVGGLVLAMLVILLAIIGVIGTEVVGRDTLVSVFSSLLTGLLGLFARSPTS